MLKTEMEEDMGTEVKSEYGADQIQILEGSYVLISKAKSPVIHFVIRHPKMVSALENFIPPVME